MFSNKQKKYSLIAILLLSILLNISIKWRLDSSKQKVIYLPQELKEVSGISFTQNANELIMVNDEQGTIYFYDYKSESITKEIDFARKGDYEGIEYLNGYIYVLRSDGKLFEINPDNEVTTYALDKKIKEFEGLTYNPKIKQLVIIAKSKRKDRTEREAYSFDPETKDFSQNPLFVINREGLKLNPSAITYLPDDDTYYVLSSKAPLLIKINHNGQILNTLELDQGLFPQPEGLVYNVQQKVLFVSNEGRYGSASLVRIKT